MQIEELEDADQLLEDARFLLEVDLLTEQAERERALQQKNLEAEDRGKQLIKQIYELEEEQLPGERRGKIMAVNVQLPNNIVIRRPVNLVYSLGNDSEKTVHNEDLIDETQLTSTSEASKRDLKLKQTRS